MILQSLKDYYERKRSNEPDAFPPLGFEEAAISFVVVIDKKGRFKALEDWRIGDGKRRYGRSVFVPQGKDRPGKNAWETAFLLWDHPRYIFGVAKDSGDKKLAAKRLKTFQARITHSFPNPRVDEGVNAVVHFYADSENMKNLRKHELWSEVEQATGNVSFQLAGSSELVCQRPAVVKVVRHEFETDPGAGQQQCLVSGEVEAIERLHPATPVLGSQATAKLHSFNLEAFNSYGKEQGINAPVGKRAAFAYTAALNRLLARDSKQQIRVGDATMVFWAERRSALEDSFGDIFSDPPKDNPEKNVRAMRALFEAPQHGVVPAKDEETRFFVLGLAPNIARVAVRFWLVGTVAEMVGHIQRHFDDLEIVRPPYEKPYLSLFRLLVSTAALGKSENIPPNLGGDVMRAILGGQPYPLTLLQNAVRRIRAEQAKKDERGNPAMNVTYPRAAIIKACLNRYLRNSQTHEKEMTVTLDITNSNPGYRLGRLFAVLEKVQEEANPDINATIRDRFYGAASSTPVTVFSNLMKLKNHHLAKLDNPGRRVNLERLIGEIMDGVTDFPAHLDLADQGRFAIGYYHQRQAFFSKSTESKGE